jgi:hypothetical protein
MAVIEIAKIQVRRGQENQTGIPQLAGGEFAWAADTEKLYIGLKREDGGARDANIQILTENDFRLMTNLMSAAALNADYTWEQPTEGEDTNARAITSLDNTFGNSVTRTSQDKLDDFVSIADFGVISSTTNDWTQTIQNAIDHLFLDKHVLGGTTSTYDVNGTLKYNKKLYFPAGIYRVGGTINIPRNAVIVGEGIDKTIIEVITTGSGVFRTVDYDGRRNESPYAPSNTFQGRFDASGTIEATWSITYPGRPKNIHIEGMTLQHSTSTVVNGSLSFISLDCVDNAVIRDVKFQGLETWATPSAGPNYVGVDIRGYSALLTSENILIDNCQFSGLYYDVKSNYETNHIVIQNSSFTSSTFGIAFSTTTNVLASNGPTYNRMLNNKFQDIYNQGIFVGSNLSGAPTFHVVENNSFVRVGDQGNNIEGTSTVGTSVIKFATAGNASVNNYFGREKFHNLKLGTPADIWSTYYPLIDGRATIDLNSVTTGTALAFADTPIMRLPITGNSQYLQLKYTAISTETVDDIHRFGTLQIYVRPGFDFNPTTSPNQIKLIDEYNSSGSDGGIYWGLNVEETYKYVELFVSNPQPTASIKLELQTKLML